MVRCVFYFVVWCVCLAVSSAAATSVSWGQAPPPLSPWLLLDNRPQGALDNYNMWVKPRQDIASEFMKQQGQINRQGAQLQQSAAPSQSGGGGVSTGGRGAAGWRYYGHWYSGLRGDPTPNRAR